MKGFAIDRIDRLAWEIGIYDDQRGLSFTFEFKAHEVKGKHVKMETSFISQDSEGKALLEALSEALMKIGLIDKSATTAQLEATKYHLEDMRLMAFSQFVPPAIVNTEKLR